jgi:hypothetical protein
MTRFEISKQRTHRQSYFLSIYIVYFDNSKTNRRRLPTTNYISSKGPFTLCELDALLIFHERSPVQV